MAKVTSKYQVTVPRKIAEEYHIRPGDEIDWVPAGEAIRVIPPGKQVAPKATSRGSVGSIKLPSAIESVDRHAARTCLASGDGEERIYTDVAALVDTNVLV